MFWKNFAGVVALLAVMASPVSADPSLIWTFGDSGGDPESGGTLGGVTLQIIPDGTGSIEAEILITTQFGLSGAVLVDPTTFDTPNPGNNPITGTVTNGLFLDPANNQLFASFGTQVLNSTDPIDFISFDYRIGLFSASGLVAEGGVNFTNLSASISRLPSPDLDDSNEGDIDGDDFGIFVGQFGNTNGLSPPDTADFDLDGDVDGDDFGVFVGAFGNGTSTTIPEPTAALLLLVGMTVVTCASRRK